LRTGQRCHQGFNGTFHDRDGNPLWNSQLYPDPARMVANIHAMDPRLLVSFYMNSKDRQTCLWLF